MGMLAGMEVEIFCLCESAPVNPLNQPSLINIFDVKVAIKEPILIDSFLVVSSIRIFRRDEGQHAFSIICKDPHGKVLIGPKEIVSFSELTRDSTTYFYVMTMPQTQVSIGVYEFSMEIDGAQRATTVLHIEKGKNLI